MRKTSLLKNVIYNKNLRVLVQFFFLLALLILSAEYISGIFFLKIPVENTNAYHSNLLTINSIFCGFALTSLSILISINNDDMIAKIKRTDILHKRNKLISLSLLCSSIAMICALYFILEIDDTILKVCTNITSSVKVVQSLIFINNYIFILEICFLILGTTFFILSVQKMVALLNFIYGKPPKYAEKKKDSILKAQSSTRNVKYEVDDDIFS